MNQKKAGVLLSYGQTVLSTVISLVYTPVMLRLLGQSEYGTYTLVNGFISNLSLMSFGLGSAYVRYYTRAEARDGEDGVARVNGMFMTIFLFIAAASLLVGGVLVANVHNIFAAKMTPHEVETARVLMALLVVNIAVSFPCSVFTSYITAKEKFLFQRVVSMVRTVLNPIVMLPLLLAGFGSISLVVVTLVLSAVTDTLSIVYCVKRLHMRLTFGKFDFPLLREMLGFSFFIFLNMIIDQINWTVDTTLLGIISGTTATAIYGVGSQIHRYYMTLSTSISGVFIPQINRIVARGEGDDALTRLFTRVGRVQFLLLMLVMTGFIFVGRPFVQAWGGDNYAAAYPIALMLMIPTTIPLIQNLGIEIQRAKNMHQFRSKVYLAMALFNVAISIPLGMRYGGLGCAMGTAISMLVCNGAVMNWYYHRHIGLDMVCFWRSILSTVPAMLVPVLAGTLAVRLHDFTGYGGVIAFAVPYAAVYALFVYRFAMNEEERDMVRAVGRKLRGGTGAKQ
ncbi:MAG: oligosaccharide flippase family protein [Clostridiales bacterium]|nr:oligosaccharide flippase family protein [Clostridiales bacterium]